MKTDRLPQSENAEDRRDKPPTKPTPRLTLAEQQIDPKSKLSKDAGLDDI